MLCHLGLIFILCFVHCQLYCLNLYSLSNGNISFPSAQTGADGEKLCFTRISPCEGSLLLSSG